MNRVMQSYTPDLKASRMSTIGTPLSAASSFSGSATRRRYSVSFGASVSVSVNGTENARIVTVGRQTPPPVPVPVRSVSQMDTPETQALKRMSIHESLMMKILSTPVDQPLSLNDSDWSNASRCSTPETPISSEQLIESDDLLRCTTPTDIPDGHINPRLARLYKDLRSPSATTRIRALRALKSPSKREAYGQFDVPHEEQDIITAEEREHPEPKTIQEVMAGVCVYVEVRSGADNRSDGIKDHVASLGAKVNDRLYKDTTHVIFKDGLLSTYQKAKKMNIPVVSILWIEACKRHMCLMNAEDFKISNLERYEYPELFKKIRRQKSMQPRAEETTNSAGKKRPPAGASKIVISPPTKLPVLHRLRKEDELERILSEFQADRENTPEPQDDYDKLLARPMKLLEKFRNSPVSVATVSADKAAPSESEKEKEVPATPEAPLCNIRKSLFNGSSEKETGASVRTSARRRSSSVNKEITPILKPATVSRQRRKTMLFTPRITSVEEEVESPALTKQLAKRKSSPKKNRNTICTPKAMDVCKANSDKGESVEENVPPTSQKVRETIYSPSKMEQSSEKTDKIARVEVGSSRKTLLPTTTENVINSSARKTKTPELDPKELEAFKTNRRRTLYTPGVYDEPVQKPTPVLNRRSTIFNPPANSTATDKTPMTSNSLRRKTMYTPNPSIDIPATPETPINNRRHTIFTPNPDTATDKTPTAATPASVAPKRNKTILEEYQSSLTFSSTKTPTSQRRKTIFDISMDIIDKRLSQINKLSKQTDTSNGNATGLSQSESAQEALKSPPPRPLVAARQTSLDTFYRKLSKSSEKSIKFRPSTNNSNASAGSANDGTTTIRKRKLFNTQPSLAESPLPSTEAPDPICLEAISTKRPRAPSVAPESSKTPAASKRRSLAPPALSTKSASTAIKTSRRSTMLFEATPPAASRTQPAVRPVMGTQARTMKALGLGAGLPTISSQQVNKSTRGPQFHLATTNLHAAQHTFVKEVGLK